MNLKETYQKQVTEQLIYLHSKGLSNAAIGKRLGYSGQYIGRRLKILKEKQWQS